MKLYHCCSCGHLSSARSGFKWILAENGQRVLVCDDCATDYNHDDDITRWVNQAGLTAAQQNVPA